MDNSELLRRIVSLEGRVLELERSRQPVQVIGSYAQEVKALKWGYQAYDDRDYEKW